MKKNNSEIYSSIILNDIDYSGLNVYLKSYMLHVLDNMVLLEIEKSELKKDKDLTCPRVKQIEKFKAKVDKSFTVTINELLEYKDRWRANLTHSCGNDVNERLSMITFKIKPNEDLMFLFINICNLLEITNTVTENGLCAREDKIYSLDKEDFVDNPDDFSDLEWNVLMGHALMEKLIEDIKDTSKKYNLDEGLFVKSFKVDSIYRDFKMLEEIIKQDYHHINENNVCEECAPDSNQCVTIYKNSENNEGDDLNNHLN